VRSIYLLGTDTDEEWRLTEELGGAPRSFFKQAQRIAWGLTQPDLIRIDVLAAAERLVRRHGHAFPAHLYDAWVWRAREPRRAERALDRARELATPDHPLAYLLPSDDEWHCRSRPQQLVEVVPDRVWLVAHGVTLSGAPFPHVTVATIVRSQTGDLAIFNPVAFAPEIADAIERLGRVRWLAVLGKAHGRFVAAAKRRFPDALALGTLGHLEHPAAAGIVFDGVLERAELPSELEVLPIDGSMLREVTVFDRPSRTLILQDMVTSSAAGSARSFVGRLYGFAFGLTRGVGFPAYQLTTWVDIRAMQRSFRALLDTGFERATLAHAPTLVDGAELRKTLEDVLEIGWLEHKTLLARFALAQPAFVGAGLRYLRATRHATGARLAET